MTSVHILTNDLGPTSVSATLFPLLHHKSALESLGIRSTIFTTADEALTDCDTLIVDSKQFKLHWKHEPKVILEQLDAFKNKVQRLFWLDTTDSTGHLQTHVFPYVDRYFKGQLLRDRSQYLDCWYGGRIYTDHYHRTNGIVDNEPEYSMPVPSDQLWKLRVSWSNALANHSYSWLGQARTRLKRWLRRPSPLGPPNRWTAPSYQRRIPISARFGLDYSKATIKYQRERIKKLLGNRAQTDRIKRREYFLEMENSTVVLAPFGWGEFNYRDYHAFLSGALLVKPNMSHMETWPDLYRDGVTMLSFDWDLDTMLDVLETALQDKDGYLGIAETGQETYKRHLASEQAEELFAERVYSVITE